ncbi:MAG: flagellar basal body protein [Alphaproteobacteria bacterium]|nr:flagellar basal body protein [Alphaproteobacteria bacterium]MDX5368671.1 flagellar basal body protein [Alphaproteobacteria bacterium]MDX5463416.1 flagellar basal body protein [Alphaproteobacteria bacterium]
MYGSLSLLKIATGAARHAASRQTLIAQNVANADTPGYRARDLEAFEVPGASEDGFTAKATRASHGDASPASLLAARTVDTPGPENLNGNTVDLEDQLVRGAEAQERHAMALGIYGTAIDLMRTAIGRR